MRIGWPASSLTKEAGSPQNGDDRFLAVFRDGRDLDLAFLDLEDGVRRIAL